MGEHRWKSDWEVRETESVSTAVKRAIASLEECSPRSLGILGNAVDPDALDNVVGSAPGPPSEPESISFRYCGYDVLVEPSRSILVRK